MKLILRKTPDTKEYKALEYPYEVFTSQPKAKRLTAAFELNSCKHNEQRGGYSGCFRTKAGALNAFNTIQEALNEK